MAMYSYDLIMIPLLAPRQRTLCYLGIEPFITGVTRLFQNLLAFKYTPTALDLVTQ